MERETEQVGCRTGYITEAPKKIKGIPIRAPKDGCDKAAWPNSDAIDEVQADELENSRKRSVSDVVMCRARPKAVSQRGPAFPKPGLVGPSLRLRKAQSSGS